MIRVFYILMYKVIGWKVIGGLPEKEKKYVLIVAPHTSYWDFPIGLAARSILYLKTKFLIKIEAFKNPFVAAILRSMGGIPVERGNKNNGIVDAAVKYFSENDEFVLTLAPEGTRKRVKKFKSGFYRIAKQADVPIVMVSFDFKTKIVEFLKPFYLTNNLEADMEHILNYYRDKTAMVPEQGVK